LLAHPSVDVRSTLVPVLVLILNDSRHEHRLELIEKHNALAVLSAFVVAAAQERIDRHATLLLLKAPNRFYAGLSAAHVQQWRDLGIVRHLVALGFSARGKDVCAAAKAIRQTASRKRSIISMDHRNRPRIRRAPLLLPPPLRHRHLPQADKSQRRPSVKTCLMLLSSYPNVVQPIALAAADLFKRI
jgi:hypothetical protein